MLDLALNVLSVTFQSKKSNRRKTPIRRGVTLRVLGVGRMPFLRTQQKTEFSDEFTEKYFEFPFFVFDGQKKEGFGSDP